MEHIEGIDIQILNKIIITNIQPKYILNAFRKQTADRKLTT